MGKNFDCCFKIYDPGPRASFDRFFFFEVMSIIPIFLRALGKLTFDPLNGWVINF